MSKFQLLTAFITGSPVTYYPIKGPSVLFRVINKIEREDGSNRRYNLTGITGAGETATVFVITLD